MGAVERISLRGVRVHNLKSIDLDIPHRKLIVLCGLSGSGKSSLALDTLYAEGQRRYIESFSAYTRQFLQRLEKPEADRIDGIPPAIAVSGKNASRSSRATVGTATETIDYLRLLYARIGEVFCTGCGRPVRRDTPQSTAQRLAELPPGTRYVITFPLKVAEGEDPGDVAASLKEEGFVRAIVGGRMVNLSGGLGIGDWGLEQAQSLIPNPESPIPNPPPPVPRPPSPAPWYVVVDRLTAGQTADQRVRDSLETAFAKGQGRCVVLVEGEGTRDWGPGATEEEPPDLHARPSSLPAPSPQFPTPRPPPPVPHSPLSFSTQLACADCDLEYPEPEPRLYSFNSPLGACPECEGFGSVTDIDMELIVPDPGKTLAEGAIAPWNSPAYKHELEELLALAPDYGIPVDVPFRRLEPRHLELIQSGVPERDFGGLRGFFAWLERRKYKMHIRVFLSRWRSYRTCPACGGKRLRPEALATRIGGKNIAEVSAMKIADALAFFRGLCGEKGTGPICRDQPSAGARPKGASHKLDLSPFPAASLSDWQRQVGRMMLEQVQARLGYLDAVGLGYLALDRTLRTLSGGEVRRVALTAALGSSLVHMLYVLDEPSIGLHPHDIQRLIDAIRGLRDRGNTVVVVEHEEAMLRAADQVVEIGPGAGERGGRIVFQGTPQEMESTGESLTGDYLAGRRGIAPSGRRRPPDHGWIRLAGARGNNLKNLTVEFPLGLLCVVTGVSGSGKSTLVQDTLYPALCRRLRKDAPRPCAYDDVYGDGQIDDAVMVDQSPIGRSPRSNPVTYLKAFDEIRAVFAETVEARTRNYTAGYFSFNADGGRCSNCNGEGHVEIDMQFLADVYMKCPTCNGTRYRDEVLDVTYRGRHIAEVLEMTVREAFTFFRGRPKVQARLKRLIDVGLDYVRLGQPANTLSGGEAQRLKLAGYMSGAGRRPKAATQTRVGRGRCLFLLDEPTTGLHFSDVVQLLDCFEALIGVGHSLIVVEHNLQLIKAADYVVDLGPGAADEGGQVVVQGTPEMVANCENSITGRFLADALRHEVGSGQWH